MYDAKNNNKGQILVIVALALVAFIGLAALAIDVAYFYHTKHQLQGASDAAALAGAAKLDVDNSYTGQIPARQEAWKFACNNKAAGEKVFLVQKGSQNCSNPPNSDLNETSNDPAGDIVVGNWNSTRSEGSQPCDDERFLPTVKCDGTVVPLTYGTTINAVKGKSRRTDTSPGGAVGTFFGKIFGVDTVNISADAVAARTAKGSLNFSVCYKACENVPTFPSYTTIHPARRMKIGTSNSTPVVQDNEQVAWTNLPDQPSTSTSDIVNSICGGPNYVDVCSQELYATMGNPTSLLHALQSAFLDPTYDAAAKKEEYVELTGKIQGVWYGIVPVLESCATTVQGVEDDPKKVISYAEVRIIGVCPVGGMPDPCDFGLNDLDFTDELSICKIDSDGDGKKDYAESIVIDRISCISCSDKDDLYGARPFLVR